MNEEEELQIPNWLPLKERERTLLEACANEPVELPVGKQTVTRDALRSRKLIHRIETVEDFAIPKYTATDKGHRALEIDKIMKRLGLPRQRQPIFRHVDNDLSELLAVLRQKEAEHKSG
jgi:hypothetical protein